VHVLPVRGRRSSGGSSREPARQARRTRRTPAALPAEETCVPHRDDARRRRHPRLAQLLVQRLDACTCTSIPTRSTSVGPIGQPAPAVIAVSRSSGETLASSRTRMQSFRSG
jgi:hypothetical protein